MPTDIASILQIEVPVSVQIASRIMKVREVSILSPGAIIELPKLADEQLEILVSNRRIGSGTAVKVGENFGIRVTHVGNIEDRIRALGESSDQVTEEPSSSNSEHADPNGSAPTTDVQQDIEATTS